MFTAILYNLYRLKIKAITLFFLILSSNAVNAQSQVKTNDLGIWLGASLEYKLNKKYTFNFSQDVRLFESFTAIDKYITNLGVSYKVNKHFKLSGAGRYYLNKEKDNLLSQNWRYNLSFNLKFKLNKKFKLKYRARVQTKYQFSLENVYQGRASNFRNRITIDYKLNKKNHIYFGTELFREFVFYRKPYFNKIRLILGDKLSHNLGDFNYFIGYERELNTEHPFNYTFLGIYYTFKLKNEN